MSASTEATIATIILNIKANSERNKEELDLVEFQDELSVILDSAFNNLQEQSEAWKSLYHDIKNTPQKIIFEAY